MLFKCFLLDSQATAIVAALDSGRLQAILLQMSHQLFKGHLLSMLLTAFKRAASHHCIKVELVLLPCELSCRQLLLAVRARTLVLQIVINAFATIVGLTLPALDRFVHEAQAYHAFEVLLRTLLLDLRVLKLSRLRDLALRHKRS